MVQHYCRVGRQFLNWTSPGKIRMRCGMTRHQSNKHCNVRALSHKVKCDCSVQRIGTNSLQTLRLHQSTQLYVVRLFVSLEKQVGYIFFLNEGLKAELSKFVKNYLV